MGMRFNPPPNWPPAPDGYVPPPGWQPQPSWPPAPPGWPLWVDDGNQPGAAWAPLGAPVGGTCRLAVAAFVLSLLGFTVIGTMLAIILGIVALRRIRRTREKGRDLAVAALVFSGLWVVMILGALAFVGIGIADRRS